MASRIRRPAAATATPGAIALLTAEHRQVATLFTEFDKLRRRGLATEKAEIVERVCDELKIHAQIEEEIFYPAVRKAIGDPDLMDEALVEHAGAGDLVAQLEDMDAGDDLYDAKVTVLRQRIEHHVDEEERQMFPRSRKAGVDDAELGARLLERRDALRRELGIGDRRGTEVVLKLKSGRRKPAMR